MAWANLGLHPVSFDRMNTVSRAVNLIMLNDDRLDRLKAHPGLLSFGRPRPGEGWHRPPVREFESETVITYEAGYRVQDRNCLAGLVSVLQ
jgi:hypothetical protein